MGAGGRSSHGSRSRQATPLGRVCRMARSWIWLQGVIVVFVIAGMVIAITRLA